MENNSAVLSVNSFLRSLIAMGDPGASLLISASNFGVISPSYFDRQVEGLDWCENPFEEQSFAMIMADLPIGMGRQHMTFGDIDLFVRRSWRDITLALRLLTNDGICFVIIEPPGFGIADGPKFEEVLNINGFYVAGIFNLPAGLWESTSIRPVLVAIGRHAFEKVFVSEIEDEEQASATARAFYDHTKGIVQISDLLIPQKSFRGFASLKAERQLSRLETHYKEYDSVCLGDIAKSINSVKVGERFSEAENSVYIPMLGSSEVTYDIEQTGIKHQNFYQVELSDEVECEYLSAFFNSELGKLVRNAATYGAVIPKIRKSDLSGIKVALPRIVEQREIAHTYRRLSTLRTSISRFQVELALNPKSAAAIKAQLESMLEQIGALTDGDKVLSLARTGESKILEYKASFSLDIKKGTKEKTLEQSVMKTLVAFMNSSGGTLLVGVSDDGAIRGIEDELTKFHKSSRDDFLLYFKNQLKHRIGEQFYSRLIWYLDKLNCNKFFQFFSLIVYNLCKS